MNTCKCRFLCLLALVMLGCSQESLIDAGSGVEESGGGYTFPVTYVEMKGGLVREMSELSGDVASKRFAKLAFERPGRIKKVFVHEGDVIEEGQSLARLDNSILQAEFVAALAAERVARIQREYAEKELHRFEGMGAAASDADRDQWRFEIDLRTALESQRSAERRSLERQLLQGELHAPFSGVLVTRKITLGSYAIRGSVVFEIVDLDHREVRVELPQALAVRLKPGLSVEIHSPALREGMLKATLKSILPAAQSSARTFTGLIDLPHGVDLEHRLLPGAYVRVKLETRRAEVATVVPADALIRKGEQWFVVVADDGTPPLARFVAVSILANDGRRAAIAAVQDGELLPSAKIVVTGTDNVFPSAPLLLQPHQDPSQGGRGLTSASDS